MYIYNMDKYGIKHGIAVASGELEELANNNNMKQLVAQLAKWLTIRTIQYIGVGTRGVPGACAHQERIRTVG